MKALDEIRASAEEAKRMAYAGLQEAKHTNELLQSILEELRALHAMAERAGA